MTLTYSVSSSLIDVTCSIPPPAINTSGTAVVTISATRNAHTTPWRLPRIPSPPRGVLWALALVLATVVFLRKRPVYLALSLTTLAIGTLFMVSCGGTASGGSKTTVTPLSLYCAVPSVIPVNVAYSGSGCAASGGTRPYLYGVTFGFIPTGLSVNATSGAITGHTQHARRLIFHRPGLRFQFSSAASRIHSPKPHRERHRSTHPKLPSLANINRGRFDTTKLLCKRRHPTHHLAVSSGTLPAGLSLTSQAGGYFSIGGTPTKTGNISFALKATDSSIPLQTASQSFAATVNPRRKVSRFLGATLKSRKPMSLTRKSSRLPAAYRLTRSPSRAAHSPPDSHSPPQAPSPVLP